jgi:hypothetical protein
MLARGLVFFSRTPSRSGGRQHGTRLRKHVPPCTRARRHASGFRRGHCERGLPPGAARPAHAAGFYHTKEPESRVRMKVVCATPTEQNEARRTSASMKMNVQWKCTGDSDSDGRSRLSPLDLGARSPSSALRSIPESMSRIAGWHERVANRVFFFYIYSVVGVVSRLLLIVVAVLAPSRSVLRSQVTARRPVLCRFYGGSGLRLRRPRGDQVLQLLLECGFPHRENSHLRPYSLARVHPVPDVQYQQSFV